MKSPKQNKAQTPTEKKILNLPQNKDNLDSREREEQTTMGEKMTHNKKERKSENKKK